MDNNEQQEPKKFLCYELEIVDESDDAYMSLVKKPAIQIDWVAFSENGEIKKEKVIEFKVQDESKRMLTGVFMSADMPIYRVDEETGQEYFVKFNAENIEKAAKKFASKKLGANVDTEHNMNKNGCYIMDSWYIRDSENNPLRTYGFKVKEGDWVGTVHVPDEEFWNEYIRTGELKGFSIMDLFKFGQKTVIEGYSEKKSLNDFTTEEHELINKIVDLLLGDEE